MEKLKEFYYKVLCSNKMKTFYWQSAVNFLGLLTAGMASLDWQYTAVMLAVLNGLSKYLNQKYL